MVYDEIRAEEERATKLHGQMFNSLHEAYAVIVEELDEVWDIVRQQPRKRSIVALRREFIQIAAMAVRAINSLEKFGKYAAV